MIRGTTKLVGILGSPVAQVKSPENFNDWFQSNTLDLAMLAIDMRASELASLASAMRGWNNLCGCVITVPYKLAMAELVDHLSPRAKALRSVNVLRREADGRLSGDNVDGEGFLNAATAHGFDPQGKQALVIGAGGVGAAIAWSLCEAGVCSLGIADLDDARVQTLSAILQSNFPKVRIHSEYSTLAGFDLVANATPVGMGGTGATPLPACLLHSLDARTLVADVVTSPAITPFLELARSQGCRIQTGAQMARAQMGNLGAFMGVTPLNI
ncbi:shikimate dehydrogenase [Pseudomonas sp. 3A(2025)]